jgi:hypothetical protein
MMNQLDNLSSGIEGQVSFGPISPVVRPGIRPGTVNYRPYQATITILDEEGQTVTRCQSDMDGKFRVSLKPGRYTLIPESPGPRPHAPKQAVTVSEGEFIQVRVNYDSGIR